MKHEQLIKDVYYMAGLLECISCMQGQTLTESMAYVLADCVDRLELIGAQLLAKELDGDEGKEEAFTRSET